MNSALLKLQIGPVQDFIAQARSTRDLWSGSYLLSWLMAAGAVALVKKVGGKASVAISPTLEGQPLFDLHQEIILRRAQNPSGKEPLFKAGQDNRRILNAHDNDDLLTPNFTNILVAELPAGEADAATQAMVTAIHDEWRKIAEACWDKLQSADLVEDMGWRRDRFQRQLSHFPNITWQLTALPPDGKIQTLLAGVPLKNDLLQKLLTARLADGSPDLFPAQITRNSWQLDAVRQLREFNAWGPGGWTGNGLPNEKDSVTGREEGLVGGKNWWKEHFETREETINNRQRQAVHLKDRAGRKRESALWPILFREQDDSWFGAIQLVKRLWHWAYLTEQIGLEATHRREPNGKQYPFPSTPQVAIHDPAKNIREDLDELAEELEAAKQAEEHSRYFSVLAVDGDHMGQWLGGENTAAGPKREFRRDLSVRLSNFALRCVRPIVEACNGRLIVAGGEDVTALLPADTALDCARFLRAAYRGEDRFIAELKSLAARLCQHHLNHGYEEPPNKDDQKPEMSAYLVAAKNGTLFPPGAVPGTLLMDPELGASGSPLSKAARNLRLPGGIIGKGNTNPELSAGIAIAHYKDPLQDVVRAAHAALHDAKNLFGRAAIAVTLVKHSGETVEWGCKWESGGLELLDLIQHGRAEGIFSNRFPHRLAEVLSPYLLACGAGEAGRLESVKYFDDHVDEIIQREFVQVLNRQKGSAPGENRKTFLNQHRPVEKLAAFLKKLADATVQTKLRAVIGLCQVAAFIEPAVYSPTFIEKKSRL